MRSRGELPEEDEVWRAFRLTTKTPPKGTKSRTMTPTPEKPTEKRTEAVARVTHCDSKKYMSPKVKCSTPTKALFWFGRRVGC